MRTLRVVGPGFEPAGERDHLVLEAVDTGERFAVDDSDIRTALRAVPAPGRTEGIPEPAASGPAPGSQQAEVEISPREIQTRVRSGESPEQVAAALGTTVAQITRFAAPVVEERLRITDEARRARARRTGGEARTAEPQTVVFGEAVDERFAAHGVAPTEVTWDSYRREDGDWVVVAEWRRGETTHDASWVFHRATRSVTALDETAADLLSDRPIRPALPPEPMPAPLRPGVVAFPPMPEALTGPLPVVEDVFDQEAPDLDAPRTPPFASVDHVPDAPHPYPAHVESEAPTGYGEFEEPPLPLGIAAPSSRLASIRNLGRHQESEEERAERVKVPSWDDILLGVRRKQD